MFKDEIKEQKIGGLVLPEIEGKVKIELFNAETEELEQSVEEKNLVTNAVRDILASNHLGLTAFYQLMPISTTLFGGILCFKDTLTEDADEYYPPNNSQNELIAHAGQTTYSSADDDLTRGLPNSSESSIVLNPNGYQFVWDFPASQGNGKISAVALTHKDTGDYWLNNGTSFIPLQEFTSVVPMGAKDDTYTNANYILPIAWDTTNGYAYTVFGSGTSMTLRRYKIGNVNNISLNQNVPMFGTVIDGVSTHLYDDHTYTLPYDYLLYRYLFIAEDNELHCIRANGDTLYRTIINLSTFASSTSNKTINNANMSTTNSGGSYARAQPIYLDDDGYLYVPKAGSSGATTTLYKIDYDGVSHSELVLPSAQVSTHTSTIGIGHHGLNTLTSVVVDGDRIIKTNPALDTDEQESRTKPWVKMSNSPIVTYTHIQDYRYLYTRNALWKMYMATIKNLQTPITKTATQSMRITYTITEVQSNEGEE